MTETLITDTECFHGRWAIGFKRVSDGKVVVLQKTDKIQLNTVRLEGLIRSHRIVTFNGLGYDAPLIWAAIEGSSNKKLKKISDAIIRGNVPWWEVENVLRQHIPHFGRIPRTDHIDLMEPQPNARASLKALNGRLHAKRLQDLPYDPDRVLTDEEWDQVLEYMVHGDLEGTHLLFDALKEPLELREAMGAEFGMNFMSKSDSQMGEGIIKKRFEVLTGNKPKQVATVAGTTFRYNVPSFISFKTAPMQAMLARLRETDFVVKADGKVDLPKWLEKDKIELGSSIFQMGIGGLHSTEANRAVHSDETHVLVDLDVASQYPAIVLALKLYPKSLGPSFLQVYQGIMDDRLAAKAAKQKAKDKGLKIALNGGFFGKTGSRYSVLFAPHVMIGVTLTGQLTLLMLIEDAISRGIDVVSGNTDGVVLQCPRELYAGVEKDRLLPSPVADMCADWEAKTSFKLEAVEYTSIFNRDVNNYIALKASGGHKRKGVYGNWWSEHPDDADPRMMLMKNPTTTICSDAVLAFLKDGVPVEETIRACQDFRQFISIRGVDGGATWKGQHLGKVVRWYYATGDTAEIRSKKPNAHGTFNTVARSTGARPAMMLPDELPADIDYAWYIAEAKAILVHIGAAAAPPKPLKFRSRPTALAVVRAWALAA